MTAERTPLAVLIGAAGEAPGILSPTQTTVQNVPTAHWWAQKKRKRTVACGKCDACCRDDCGRCLNCCDKPKFGGPGARRKFPPACKLPTEEAHGTVLYSTSSSRDARVSPQDSAARAPP